MGMLQSLSLHEKDQGHCLGEAEYLLKEQEQSICSKEGLGQCSVCALKHQRVLLTPRSSTEGGPGVPRGTGWLWIQGAREAVLTHISLGRAGRTWFLLPPQLRAVQATHACRGVEGAETCASAEQGWQELSWGFQREGSREQARWRGEGSQGDRADPSGAMQGNRSPPLRR